MGGLLIPYRFWRKLSLPLILLSFLSLAFLFLPQLSVVTGGARRWLHLGFITFQPAELLKLSFIIYLASWLDARRSQTATISYGMIPFAIMLAMVGIFLVMQPDIGTLGIIIATSIGMYYLGGGRAYQVATILSGILLCLFLLVQLAPYRLARVTVFLNPGHDPQGLGYHINQAFIAIATGGVAGLGFGKSIQKYNYLPEPMGDSIFAVAAEEFGFIGVTIIIAFFVFFFWRGLTVARRAPDIFGKLLASGISLSIMTQAFVNMAAISGLLPLTGIPLPFISYGGTSLAVSLAGVGILLNISRASKNVP